jgi:hypothetical protein
MKSINKTSTNKTGMARSVPMDGISIAAASIANVSGLSTQLDLLKKTIEEVIKNAEDNDRAANILKEFNEQ